MTSVESLVGWGLGRDRCRTTGQHVLVAWRSAPLVVLFRIVSYPDYGGYHWTLPDLRRR